MPNPKSIKRSKTVSFEKWVLLISLSLLTVGCVGYFLTPRGLGVFYIFAHLGALGLLGLIGSGVGTLARKKGRGYTTALFLSSLLPIAAGGITVAAIAMAGDQVYCGGSVRLAVAVLVVIGYLFTRKRTLPRSRQPGI